MPKARPPAPDTMPFIKDEDMPPGSLDATAGGRAAGPLPRHVFVVTTVDDAGGAAPRAAFKTAPAASEAAAAYPESQNAQIHGLTLYGSLQDWQSAGGPAGR